MKKLLSALILILFLAVPGYASNLCDAYEDFIIEYVFLEAGAALPIPTTSGTGTFVALYTAEPGDANASGTEVSGTGYARKEVAAAGWTNASGTTDNDAIITFATVGAGGWGTVSHFAVYDALTNGNCIVWGALTQSKPTSENDVVSFAAGELDITID